MVAIPHQGVFLINNSLESIQRFLDQFLSTTRPDDLMISFGLNLFTNLFSTDDQTWLQEEQSSHSTTPHKQRAGRATLVGSAALLLHIMGLI